MTKKYNGWKNYETWAVSLWLDNDQGSYGYWRDVAREVAAEAKATNVFTREEVARIALASRLREEIGDGSPCPDSGLYTDLLNAALSEVDWHEIAVSFLEDFGQDTAPATNQ